MTNWFQSIDFQPPRLRAPSFAFSLLELLVVIAIIAMMVGLSAVAVQGFRAPAVRQAAEQAMSGLSLARQIAITKNTHAAFLIANQTNAGFPSEPFRHWSVVYSNKGSSPPTWTVAKDWEELPEGAVFLETLGSTYQPLQSNNIIQKIGEAFTPTTFEDVANYILPSVPSILFKSDGASTGENQTIKTIKAIRIAQGTVMGGNVTLTSTNQYFFIETDNLVGRIRMRHPESYK
jgi:type II secretory pathway pseudopilin PulG